MLVLPSDGEMREFSIGREKQRDLRGRRVVFRYEENATRKKRGKRLSKRGDGRQGSQLGEEGVLCLCVVVVDLRKKRRQGTRRLSKRLMQKDEKGFLLWFGQMVA